MSNTLSVTKVSPDRVRVTVHSEGERDLSAVVDQVDLIAQATDPVNPVVAAGGEED